MWRRPLATGQRQSVKSAAALTALASVQLAAEDLQSGRLAEAESLAQSVLALHHQDQGALKVLGSVALKRNQFEEAIAFFERVRFINSKDPKVRFSLGEAHRLNGNLESALRHFQKAAHLNPAYAEAHTQIGETLRALGRFAEAAAAYRTALTLQPDSPNCLHGLGVLLATQGNPKQAVPLFEATIRTTAAHLIEEQAAAWANLGKAQIEAGDTPQGLLALKEAVDRAPEEPMYWRLLARSLSNVKEVPRDEDFGKILFALFQHNDVDPRLLATAAVAAIKQDLLIERLVTILAEDPTNADTAIAASRSTVDALISDELFLALLMATPIRDLGLEVLLTAIRRSLLMSLQKESAEDQSVSIEFVCLLARQCDLNEYVYWVGPDEETVLAKLFAGFESSDFSASTVGDWNGIAVLACYTALYRTPFGNLDLERAPEALRLLLTERFRQAEEEDHVRKGIVTFKPVHDTVSLAVQRQYEENPYPRWTRCQKGTPKLLRDVITTVLPHVEGHEVSATEAPRILVAGCGTGIQTMNVLQTYSNPSVLSVDLSLSSLAYGIRKLAEYGIHSVRHAQADILDLVYIPDRFDLIESFGVLHHMREPLTGLRVLADLLAPEGVLLLGLYSEIARSSVCAGRELLAELGLSSTPADIRAGRRAIIAGSQRLDLSPLINPASDFWTLSECRDMIFHVEEHRFSLIEIGAMLESCGLECLGLELAHPSDRARFFAEHPNRADYRSLQAWHLFETRYPQTFGDTYRIWAKRARSIPLAV